MGIHHNYRHCTHTFDHMEYMLIEVVAASRRLLGPSALMCFLETAEGSFLNR